MAVHYRNGHPFVPLSWHERSEDEMLERARAFYEEMDRRRSVRDFSDRPVARGLIELAIRTASTAPSGAHRQPWRFVAVSDPAIKRAIRQAAEEEERLSYEGRMSEEWLSAISHLGTSWSKPYLEDAPWLVVLFEVAYDVAEDGTREKNYYVRESVGIAAGVFIAALHYMGLATLTHTPSPMAFLSRILGRPKNERPMVLFPVGFPKHGALVPDLARKSLDEVAVWNPHPAPDEGAAPAAEPVGE